MGVKKRTFAGIIVGVFAVAALFGLAEGLQAAAPKKQLSLENTPLVQTTNSNVVQPQQGEFSFFCPIIGDGSGAGVMARCLEGTMIEVVAAELGMSEEQLLAMRSEGKSFAALAEEQGIHKEDLLEKMKQSRRESLEQLVENGDITQAQMDGLLERMEVRMEQALERETYRPMNGKGGHGGQGAGWKRRF